MKRMSFQNEFIPMMIGVSVVWLFFRIFDVVLGKSFNPFFFFIYWDSQLLFMIFLHWRRTK